MAGRESVTRLINRRCTGANGVGSAIRDVYKTLKIPAMLPDSRNLIAFRILRYTFRPLATALIIVAKLSSVRIMEAASLETSVPIFPMATPMSAFLRAGASLTPSPVMATIWPFRCHALTILILCSGDTRAYTLIRSRFRSSSSSAMSSSSGPLTAIPPSFNIPIFSAMAAAVIL